MEKNVGIVKRMWLFWLGFLKYEFKMIVDFCGVLVGFMNILS